MFEAWTEYSRFLIALVVIVDPFAAIPLFLTLTADRIPGERRRIARIASMTAVGVLLVSALAGEAVLAALGTSLASFRVGGGIVLGLTALSMLRSDPAALAPPRPGDLGSAAALAVAPLAVPMLAGPGAISTVIIEMHRSHAPLHPIAVIACVLLAGAALWAALAVADRIAERLGGVGLAVANRLFGVFLMAIAVEIAARGAVALFPGLGS